MRVLHLTNGCSLSSGGAERIVARLHTQLRARGVDSRVLGLTPGMSGARSIARSVGLGSPYGLRAAWEALRFVIGELGPVDVLHVHTFPAVFYGAIGLLLRRDACQALCTEHSAWNRRRSVPFGRLLDRFIYGRYDRVACISEGVRASLAEWLPSEASKLHVIHNGVPSAFPEFTQRPPRDRLTVVSVGGLRRAKNYPAMLRAFSAVGSPAIRYRIAGRGEQLPDLEALARDLGVGDRVEFLGHVEDVPSLLCEADLFFMASSWEGFGLAAVEAMNAGLPVVASDVAGLREVVGDAGILVDPECTESQEAALRTLLESRETRIELGRRAFERSLDFSEKRMVDQYLSHYSSMLRSGVRSGSAREKGR